MNKYLIYFLVLTLSVLFVYFANGFVIIFASLLIIFDRCLFGRVKIIHGIEFTNLSIVLIAIKYDLTVSVLFCVLVLHILPAVINSFIGDRWIINKEFKQVRSSFGAVISFISVLIVFYLRSLDLFLIMFIVLLFRHVAYILKGKITQTNYVLDYLEITINFLFNLSLVYFFYSFWLLLLA